MSLQAELNYDEFIARAKAYGQSLQDYPAKKDVWRGDDDRWEEAPPVEAHTQEDFELTVAFVRLVGEIESQRSIAKSFPGLYPAPPESLGLPRLTYADDDIFGRIEPKELLAIWEAFLNDGVYYRPDVLSAGVADAVSAYLNDLFDDLLDEIFSSSGVLYRQFDGSERSVLSKLNKARKETVPA